MSDHSDSRSTPSPVPWMPPSPEDPASGGEAASSKGPASGGETASSKDPASGGGVRDDEPLTSVSESLAAGDASPALQAPSQGGGSGAEPGEQTVQESDAEEVLELDLDDLETEDASRAGGLDVAPPVATPPPAPPPAPRSGDGAGAMASASEPKAGDVPPPASPAPDVEAASPAQLDPVAEALRWARSEEIEGLLAVYAREAEAADDKGRQALLQYEMGEVLESRMDGEPEAIKAYSKALRLDREFLPNLWAIRRVFWRRKLWPNLLKLLEVELKVVQDDAFRRVILLEKGDVLRMHQGDLAGALACYEEAHSLDPSDLAPILALEKVYAEQGRLGDLFRVGLAHVAATGDPARKEAILVSLARVEEQLPDANYERRRELLHQALEVSPAPQAVLYELERIAREADRVDDLLDVLERHEALLLGDATRPQPRDGTRGTDSEGGDAMAGPAAVEADGAAKSEGEPGDAGRDGEEQATEGSDHVVEPQPGGEGGGAVETSEMARGGSEKDVALGSTLTGAEGGGEKAGSGDGTDRGRRELAAAVLALRRARLLEQRGEGDAAWRVLERLSARLGGHPVVCGVQLALAARLGRWGELADVLARSEQQATAEERPYLALERVLALRRAGRRLEAAEALSALDGRPELSEVVLALRELDALSSSDAAAEAALVESLLERSEIAEGTDGPEAGDRALAHLQFRRAFLALERGEPVDHVLDLLRQVRAVAPAHPGATALLEALLERKSAWDDLAALYRQELVDAQDALADYLLESLVELNAGIRADEEGWLDALQQLRLRHPDSHSLLWWLAGAFGRTGRWADLVDTLERVATADPPEDPGGAVQAALWAARTAWERLQDADRAERLLGRALELEPGHPESFATLEWILREAGRTEALAALLEQGADAALDAETRRERLIRLGWLLERDAGRAAAAAEVYERLWQLDPEDPEALALLARARQRAGDAGGAAEAMEQAAVVAEAPRLKAMHYRELGELLLFALGDAERAEEAFLAARAADPESVAPLLSLADLAAQQRDWQRLRELLLELLQADVPAELRRYALGELAWLEEGPVADPVACGAHLGELADADPPPATAVWAQGRMAVARQDWGGAAATFDQASAMAEKAGAAELASALAVRAAFVAQLGGDEPEAAARERWVRASALTESSGPAAVLAADLLRPDTPGAARRPGIPAGTKAAHWALLWASALHRQGETAAAAEALRSVLTGRLADMPVLAVLRALASEAGDPVLAADCCERMAALFEQDDLAVSLIREGARLVPGTEAAARMLRQGLARAPEDVELVQALAETLLALDRVAEAERVLSYGLSLAPDDAAELSLRLQRARIRQDRLADAPGAAVDLYQILSIDPEQVEALMRLARLHGADGGYEEAADLLRRRIELGVGQEDDPGVREAHLLLVEVLERAGRPVDEVLEPLEALLLMAPEDAEIWEWKVAVLLRARQYEGAVEALRARYRLESATAKRVEGALREARLYREHVANLDAARKAYERARELDPRNPEAILALCDLYREFGDSASLGYLLSGAVDAYREALGEQGPVDPAQVRFLSRLFQEGGEQDARFFALSVLEVLGDLDDEEAQALERFRRALVDRAPGRLTGEHWSTHLCHPDALGPVASVWELISPASFRLMDKDLADYGLGRGDRVQPDRASGAAKAVFELASQMGVTLESLYVGGEDPESVSLLATRSGPVLLVGSRVKSRLPAEVRHRVGEILARLRLGVAAVEAIGDSWLEALLTAAAREGRPDFETRVPLERVEEAAKHIRRTLSRKERKGLPVVGASLVPGGLDLPRWRQGVARTAARAGLLCSGDLRASLAEATGTDPEAAVRVPEGQALIRFALSDAHIELRLRLGVAR